jgi:hypothetical protein
VDREYRSRVLAQDFSLYLNDTLYIHLNMCNILYLNTIYYISYIKYNIYNYTIHYI